MVLRAATARDDIPWVVTNSCPGTTPAVQERHALAQHLSEAHAHSRDDVERTLDLYDRLVEAGRRDADFATALRLVDQAGRPPGWTSTGAMSTKASGTSSNASRTTIRPATSAACAAPTSRSSGARTV
ncbi:hypothetical protein ACQPXT_01955 [Streptomyces sp. CA-100214]